MPVLPPVSEGESAPGDASGGLKADEVAPTVPTGALPADSASSSSSDGVSEGADSIPAAASGSAQPPASPDLHHSGDALESASESRAVVPASAGITVPPAAPPPIASPPTETGAAAKPAANADVAKESDDDEEDDAGSLSGQDPVDSKPLAALEKAKSVEPPAGKEAPDAAITAPPDAKADAAVTAPPDAAPAPKGKPDAAPAPESKQDAAPSPEPKADATEPHVNAGAPVHNGEDQPEGQGLEDGPAPLSEPSGSKPTPPPSKAEPRPPVDKFYAAANDDYPPPADRLGLANGHTDDLQIPYRALGMVVLVFLVIFMGMRWRRRPRYGSSPPPMLVVQDELPVAHKPRQYRD